MASNHSTNSVPCSRPLNARSPSNRCPARPDRVSSPSTVASVSVVSWAARRWLAADRSELPAHAADRLRRRSDRGGDGPQRRVRPALELLGDAGAQLRRVDRTHAPVAADPTGGKVLRRRRGEVRRATGQRSWARRRRPTRCPGRTAPGGTAGSGWPPSAARSGRGAGRGPRCTARTRRRRPRRIRRTTSLGGCGDRGVARPPRGAGRRPPNDRPAAPGSAARRPPARPAWRRGRGRAPPAVVRVPPARRRSEARHPPPPRGGSCGAPARHLQSPPGIGNSNRGSIQIQLNDCVKTTTKWRVPGDGHVAVGLTNWGHL